MTTVTEFKDLGVVFIKGDERSSSVKGHGDMYMSEDMAYGSNNKPNTGHESIISFAWRPLDTLPDNPKFACEIDTPNHRWRPMLEQVTKSIDTKQVFTQEMTGAGESASDSVKNPRHYQLMDGVESIEIIARSLTLEQWKGFCLGNMLKYRIRAGKKDSLEQDISKANFYNELFEMHKSKCHSKC